MFLNLQKELEILKQREFNILKQREFLAKSRKSDATFDLSQTKYENIPYKARKK